MCAEQGASRAASLVMMSTSTRHVGHELLCDLAQREFNALANFLAP
jgi:hypothetical protein